MGQRGKGIEHERDWDIMEEKESKLTLTPDSIDSISSIML